MSNVDPIDQGAALLRGGLFLSGAEGCTRPFLEDNVTFDLVGNLWIATGGQPKIFRRSDGIYAVPVDHPLLHGPTPVFLKF